MLSLMLKIIRRGPQFLWLLYLIITPILSNVQISVASDHKIVPVELQLVSELSAVNNQKTLLAGLELKIASGWKVYAPHDNPHDGPGTSNPFERQPQFDWTHNDNVKNISIKWPKSGFIDEDGVKVPVYTKHVVIPLVVEVDDPTQPVHLEGNISLITCSTMCLPMEHNVALHIFAGPGQPTEYASQLLAAQCNTDSTSSDHGPDDEDQTSLLWMLMIAFLGGIILNFMPCVLPILSLKLKFLVSKHTSSYRLNFASTFVGIMISFILFAVLAIVLRQSGQVFGWGTHFQQPYFLTFMTLLMVVFACSIGGLLELTLPDLLQRRLNVLVDQKFDQSQVIVEGLVSGIIATLLATPCTAPFLGTAIGFALSKGAPEILLMFAVLGIGFGFPYLIGLILPIRYIPMPKPGRWMNIMSKVLAFGLIITALWLLSILNDSKGPKAACLVGGTAGFIIVVLYCFKPGSRWRYLVWASIAAAFISTHYFADQNQYNHTHAELTEFWQPFDPDRIARELENKKIVFVDVTASWCTTCHVNKIMVINRDRIKKLLSSSQIVAMRADWTNRDPTIGKFLAGYRRYGIPFNIVYGPKNPQGIVLPELLTESDVVEALTQAGFID